MTPPLCLSASDQRIAVDLLGILVPLAIVGAVEMLLIAADCCRTLGRFVAHLARPWREP